MTYLEDDAPDEDRPIMPTMDQMQTYRNAGMPAPAKPSDEEEEGPSGPSWDSTSVVQAVY